MPIQLPALGIQAPQQTDILGQAAKLRQFQAMGQEQQLRGQQIQAGQLENQQRMRDLQDQQTAQQILGKHNGDLDSALPELSSAVSAKTYLGIKKTATELNQQAVKMKGEDLDNKIKTDNMVSGIIDGALNLPPDQYAAMYPQIAQKALEADPSLKGHVDPTQPIPQEQLGQLRLLYQTQTTALAKEAANRAQAEENRKAALAPSQLASSQADATIKQAEAAAMQGGGVNPKIPLEVQEANSWLKLHPGKTLADYQKYKATLVPAFNFNLQNATGAGGGGAGSGGAADIAKRFGYTPTAFDQAAEKYWSSGQLPPAGRGGPALAANKAIQNRAAELHPEGSLAANSAEYKANSESLKKFQTQFDSVNAFENTAEKNINRLLETAQSIPDLGARFANIPIRMISEKAIGTENMARFRADLLTAQNESAKVLNSANMTGVLSDSARKELQDLANGNLSYGALKGAFEEIKRDMGNRKQSYQEQIADIKGRLGTKQQPPSTTPAVNPIAGGFSWDKMPEHK